MDVTMIQLRSFVALVSAGTFTDAAIDLGVSQASVSRAVQGLERTLGFPLATRSSRSIELTPDGRRVLDRARRILAEVESLLDAGTAPPELRVGYAWSALGKHTIALQREWARSHPGLCLVLIQSNTATAGLAEGDVDVAIIRRPIAGDRFKSTVVGTEKRYAAVASDDPLARKRTLTLDDFADRVVGIDRRTGTTTPDLWLNHRPPGSFRDTQQVADWLHLIGAGEVIGMTSEATISQNALHGIAFRPVRDAPAIDVRIAWRETPPPPHLTHFIDTVSALFTQPEQRSP